MNGIILVNKKSGMTSHDVCARLKRLLGTKKIGHTGTLDPMAEGLLVVLVGSAARLSEYFEREDKIYLAGITFGVLTDTLDTTGKEIAADEPDFSLRQLNEALIENTGEIDQIPPAYSAIKLNGKHLYEYARRGESVELAPRKVLIENIELVGENAPSSAVIRVHCSKGTYIRSLCRDIGKSLNTNAVMHSLVREKSGCFKLIDAFSLEEIENMVSSENYSFIKEPQCALSHIKQAVVSQEGKRFLLCGNLLTQRNLLSDLSQIENGEIVRIICEEKLFAMGKKTLEGIKPDKVLV